MDIKQVFSFIKKDMDKVEKTLKKYTLSEVALATKISNYTLFSGGKRVRPAIFMICAKMCGYDKADLYPLACAVELLHTATLLHDDVIDGASLRRGKKCANIVWENKASILVGDFLNARVFNIFMDTRDLEIIELFTRSTLNIINGEIFQLTKEKDIKITQDEYFYIVKNKTAVLMSAAAAVGGILAKRPENEKKALKSFGLNLGMAFQIIDDALDYDADEKELGKSMLADLKEGKITLPLIHILENGTRADKSMISKIIASEKHSQKDAKEVLGLIKKYDSIDYVKGVAGSFIKKAVKQLGCFPDSREKEALLTIADFIINRAY
jgi:octaprenyl-diphosphate synthase